MGSWAGPGGCLRPPNLAFSRTMGRALCFPWWWPEYRHVIPAPCPGVAAPRPPVPLRALLNTYPHALESGQCPQGTQGTQCPQGFDGSQLRVAQPVGHQADDGDLKRERRSRVSGSAGPIPPKPRDRVLEDRSSPGDLPRLTPLRGLSQTPSLVGGPRNVLMPIGAWAPCQ